MDLYFKVPLSTIPSILLLLTTQCVGFGLAGETFFMLLSSRSRHVAEPASRCAKYVLALGPRYGSAFYDALSNCRYIYRSICLTATGCLEALSSLHPRFRRDFRIPILPHAALSDLDEHRHIMLA